MALASFFTPITFFFAHVEVLLLLKGIKWPILIYDRWKQKIKNLENDKTGKKVNMIHCH